MTPIVTEIEAELPAYRLRGSSINGVHLRISTARGNAGTLFVSYDDAPSLIVRLQEAGTLLSVIGPDRLSADFRREIDTLCRAVRSQHHASGTLQ